MKHRVVLYQFPAARDCEIEMPVGAKPLGTHVTEELLSDEERRKQNMPPGAQGMRIRLFLVVQSPVDGIVSKRKFTLIKGSDPFEAHGMVYISSLLVANELYHLFENTSPITLVN